MTAVLGSPVRDACVHAPLSSLLMVFTSSSPVYSADYVTDRHSKSYCHRSRHRLSFDSRMPVYHVSQTCHLNQLYPMRTFAICMQTLTRKFNNTLLHLKSTLTSHLQALLCPLISPTLRSKPHFHGRDRWFRPFWESIFPCKFIFLLELSNTAWKISRSII
ncbi:hypothetical protein H4582DRAFT_301026 [Lactarius indigo]|nr:hypothetical protein H4582DRAFT_301026 [Lactarius indigo]